MPYFMQFTKQGAGLHELPEWPNGKKEGANHLGTPVSHGCVRVGIGVAKKLYDWTPVGTKVVVTN
jgi:lipoprotein-anchoring transpeptidase ErfK/SrfK